ncbi:MAG: tetratricopeptide repeat-containing serine protease family protein [Candidatus Hydrogenedentes bacterium]|nr:tetratricopeptide repeat-containing serine protease family protein [Candidatus Hydrogenedentota bacterium]
MHVKWLRKSLFILVAVHCAAAHAIDTEAIVQQNEKAVVVILGEKNDSGAPVQSSGCFIHESGLILSTAHQVHGVGSLHAKLIDGKDYPLSVIAVNETCEIALLKSGTRPAHVARIGDASTLRSGSPLVSIGTPENLDFSTVTGIVSNTNRTYQNCPVLQTNIPASPGSSGGPVFDQRGLLVGVLIGKLRDQEWVTIVNPVNNAYSLLKEHGVPVPGPDNGDALGEIMPENTVDGIQRQAIETYNRGVQAAGNADKIAAYGAAVKLFPTFYEAWFNLATAYAAGGEYERALESLGRAEALKSNAVEVFRGKGRVLLKLRKYPEAIACLERAAILVPTDASAHNDLGEARRQAEDLAKAASAFETALKLDPAYGAARYNLGVTYAALGRAGDAIEQFQTYLRDAPDAPDAGKVREWIAKLQAEKK